MAFEEDAKAVDLSPFIDRHNAVMDKWLDFAISEYTFSKWKTGTTLPGRMSAARCDFHKDGPASQRRVQPRTDVHLMVLCVHEYLHSTNTSGRTRADGGMNLRMYTITAEAISKTG
jgi:hypothetical protein